MSNEEKTEPIKIEMEIQLPLILDGPILLNDGSLLSEGDTIIHPTIGKGKVVRLAYSEEVGNLVYADFENGEDEIVGADFIKKVQS